MNELTPCAHCGSEVNLDFGMSGNPFISCGKCGLDMGGESQKEITEKWNRSASHWIKVEDDSDSPYYYPHRRFWVKLRDSTVTLDVSFDDCRGFIGPFRDYRLDSGEVTHWMPIPPLQEKE